jgi:hypothetical protein
MRRPSFDPESENPLTSGLHFLVVVLYAFVVQELLHAVFTNWTRVEPWLLVLAAAVLVELLHYATEDYIYTEALEEPLDPEAVHFDVLQYALHFLGVLALIAAAYAIVVPLSAAPADAVLGTGTAAWVLVFLAAQQLTFALWQVVERASPGKEVENSDGTAESTLWIPVFSVYAVALATTALGIGVPAPVSFGSRPMFAVAFVTLAGLAVVAYRFSWRSAYRLPDSRLTGAPWRALFVLAAGGSVVVNALLLLDEIALTPTVAAVLAALTLVALKAHYLHEWAGFYHRLLGTSPAVDWSEYPPG